MRPNAARLTAYSRIFSSAVFREMASKGKSALFARLIKESVLLDFSSLPELVSDAFEAAFSILRVERCRDEYVYKAALTHKVLLGTHSLKSACMLNEFRVADCKADIAILNGTATVYEIKSERDSLSRLEKQVETYRKFFARVYVIAGENHVDAVISTTPPGVGVMKLTKRQQITTIREADDRPDQICPATVFDSIRLTEASQILERLGIALPDVPNTMRHAALQKLFVRLDPVSIHTEMVNTLKRTRDLAPLTQFVAQLPLSLQAAALSVPLKRADHSRLLAAVNTNLNLAMKWT